MNYSEKVQIEKTLKKYWEESSIDKINDKNLDQLGRSLIRKSTQWLNYLEKSFFNTVVLHIAAVGALLVIEQDDKNKSKSIGTLKYILEKYPEPSSINSKSIESIFFAAHYTIKNIDDSKEETYQVLSGELSERLCKLIEDSLSEYASSSLCNDEQLVDRSKEYNDKYLIETDSTLFRRLNHRIKLLSSLIMDNPESEAKNWARAGLSYLVNDYDCIEDNLGYAGLFDDSYALKIAVELALGKLSAVGYLPESIVKRYSVLGEVCIASSETKNDAMLPSDYVLANLSIADHISLTDREHYSVALPLASSLPLLIAWLSALVRCPQNAKKRQRLSTFQLGDTVSLDKKYNAEYFGETERDGIKCFLLKAYGKKGFPSTYCYPTSDSDRICLVAKEINPEGDRGTLPNARSCNTSNMYAIEQIFSKGIQLNFKDDSEQIIAVVPITHSEEYLGKHTLFGQRLSDVYPISKIDSEGRLTPLSTQWGNSVPLLLLASRIEHATFYLDSQRHNASLVIVDSSACGANKENEIPYIAQPVLFFFKKHEGFVMNKLAQQDLHHIEWTTEDTRTTIKNINQKRAQLFHNGEERIFRTGNSRIQHVVINSENLNRAWGSVKKLQSAIMEPEEDPPQELISGIIHAYRIINTIINTYVPFGKTGNVKEYVYENLAFIRTIINSCAIDLEMVSEFETIYESLLECVSSLDEVNPKLHALKTSHERNPEYAILCGDPWIKKSIEESTAISREKIVLLGDKIPVSGEEAGAIILPSASDYKKSTLLQILEYPLVANTILIEYELEHYRLMKKAALTHFTVKNRIAADSRSRLADSLQPPVCYSKEEYYLLLGIDTSRAEKVVEKSPTDNESNDETLFDREITKRYYEYSNTSTDGNTVLAWKVWFKGGYLAYLSEKSTLRVVSHLLSERSHELEIPSKNRTELALGDLIVFHSGSSRDAIIEKANNFLDSSTREVGLLWINAIVNYATGFPSIEKAAKALKNALEKKGVTRTNSTVRRWIEANAIFPQDRGRVIQAISEITDDYSLKSNLKNCTDSLGEIHGAHLRAGRELSKEIYESLRMRYKSGSGIYESIHLEDHLFLVEIESIDKEGVLVSSSNTGILLGVDAWHE